ncbi:nucleoside hydrolase [Poseidonocella sp. HB161398]|uniref:nucleoside hydrolase n=1 Tax=Poseidonocella sp. HB161398 TaxID=2320855 RepID=UPI0011091DA8|nr:nucleoside hydrolase [Poseidonocella sp. HB161398]
MSLWVDTDFGFDDLWALLLLTRAGIAPAGISLVAGNAPLGRVIANAQGAAAAYGIAAPLHAGADRPLLRAPETAGRILGPRGMPSRGRHLPDVGLPPPPADAVAAMAAWLAEGDGPRTVLALGPLTNIALLLQRHPAAAARITRLVWMGGSDGPGNHSPRAEFNALADPEAAALTAASGLPLDVVDLMFCRRATFGPADLPGTDPLTADLLGGYLDIGLSRGRPGMAIYDPVAALAVARPAAIGFAPVRMAVSTEPGESYGETRFAGDPAGPVRLARIAHDDIAAACLAALETDPADGLSR